MFKKNQKEKIGKVAKDGTDDLTFNIKSSSFSVKEKKMLKLPNSYKNWKEIKQELQLIKNQQCKTVKDIVQSFAQITKYSQKSSISAKAIGCFIEFLDKYEHVQDQKLQEVKDQLKQEQQELKEKPLQEQFEQQQQKKQTSIKTVVSPFIKPYYFIQKILPFIASVALEIEELFPSGQIQMLITGANLKIQFTKIQVACIIAHQFLCTLHDPSSERSFPSSFLTLMKMTFKKASYHPQKFLCISHYFDRLMHKQHSNNNITFQRICLTEQQYRG